MIAPNVKKKFFNVAKYSINILHDHNVKHNMHEDAYEINWRKKAELSDVSWTL